MNTRKLKQAMNEKGLTIHGLAIKSNVAYSTAYDIMHGNIVNPKIETIVKIANTLGISLNSILKGDEVDEKNSVEN